MSHCDHMSMYVTIASMYIRRNLDAIFADLDLSSGIQGRILSELVLANENGISMYQKDVEKSFGIRRSSVNSLISNLEANGYIERISDAKDARLKKLILTEKGLQQHQKICQTLDSFEAELSADFSPEEKEMAISIMQRIIQHYENKQPVCDRKELTHD